MDKRSLARLVERANKGSSEAFSQIYNEFYKPVFYIGLKITGNEHDAGDVVQETMMQLHKDLQNIRDPKLLVAYVNRIALNRSFDILRSNKKMIATDEKHSIFESDFELKSEFIPHEYVEKEDLRQLVVKAVEELCEEQKSVVLLFYYKDLPAKEISNILGIPEPLVGSRLFLARKNIKRKLEQKRIREGLMLSMVVPALSQILKMDADAACNPELCTQHWLQLADKLGFPPETATAAIKTATANTMTRTIIKPAFPIISKAVIAATTSVVLAGTGIVMATREQLPEISDAAPQTVTQDIFPDKTPLAELDIPPAEDPKTENPAQPRTPDDKSSSQTENESIPDAGATTPAPASGNDEIIKSRSSVSHTQEPIQLGINIANRILTYPLHTTISEQQILTDAGVTVASGMTVKIDIDPIDTSVPGNYGAYVWAMDEKGTEFGQAAIIIIIRASE